MSESNTSKNRTPILIGVAIAAIVAAVIVVFAMQGPTNVQKPDRQWFYDVGTGDVFDVAHDVLAPAPAPSGATLADGRPGGVKAHLYACGSCENNDQRFVAYVTMLPPEAHDSPRGPLSVQEASVPAAIPNDNSPADLDWQPYGRLQAQIAARLEAHCPDMNAVACTAGR